MEEVLEEIGLTNKEARLYLTLLKFGSSTVQDVARHANINRSYSYNILNSLMKQGLVTYTIQSGKQYFECTQPTKLLELMKEREKKIHAIIPELENLHKTTLKKPTIEIYEQKEGIKTLLQKVVNNAHHGYVGIGSQKSFERYFTFYNEAYIRRRVENKVKATYILDDTKEARTLEKTNKKEFRETKHFKELNNVNGEIWSYGDKIILFAYEEDQPIGIEIENKELSRLFQTVFKLLWKK
jgi:HTH-type transcriptional regulator, sugar sensing transcriptional regulator